MKEKSITVIGSLNYDIILQQQRLPKLGETYIADAVRMAGGGKGANQAVQCAKLGARTYMAGAVGTDAMGDYLIRSLTEYGVDVTNVVRRGEASGLGVVNCLPSGEVTATIATGANHLLTVADIDALDDLMTRSVIVIFQMEIPIPVLEYAITLAAHKGCYVILNAAPAHEIAENVLALVDCLVVNETEASFYAGEDIATRETAEEYAKVLCKRVRDTVIITLGAGGSVICVGESVEFIPAVSVEAIESTGAGDSYVGAYAVEVLRGEAPFTAARFAARAAARTVMGVGAQPSMPRREEIN